MSTQYVAIDKNTLVEDKEFESDEGWNVQRCWSFNVEELYKVPGGAWSIASVLLQLVPTHAFCNDNFNHSRIDISNATEFMSQTPYPDKPAARDVPWSSFQGPTQ